MSGTRYTRRSVNAGLLALGATALAGSAVLADDANTIDTKKKPARTPAPRKAKQKPQPWQVLPPTPKLPKSVNTGTFDVSGAQTFFAVFGSGPPVLFLHGGLANSDYWGHQVRALADRHTVIVMDTHGHGRSALTRKKLTFEDFAVDAVTLLDELGIPSAAIVGWSDGAVTGLQLAMSHPERVTRVFAFGANSSPAGYKPGGARSPVFAQYAARCRKEYARLAPKPENWKTLNARLRVMWRSQPQFTKKKLQLVNVPTTICAGKYDEIIKLQDTKFLAGAIPDARLEILPKVSHFAMIQNPLVFSKALEAFLAET